MPGDYEGEAGARSWARSHGHIFASVGRFESEGEPRSGHGWMTRLVDAAALAAAGFGWVRNAELWGSLA